MGLASDFGKSIVRGAGYSIGRNLVGGLGRNRITSSYREKISDSYENQRINSKFQRSVFDVLDESEESVKSTYDSKLEVSNWQFIGSGQSFIFGLLGVIMFFVFAVINSAFFKESGINLEASEIREGTLPNFLVFLGLILLPIFQSKLFIKLLHLLTGTKKRKEKEANEYLESGLQNIQNLRKTYNEGLDLVKQTWGEEFVKSYQNRIPKEGMHIEPFTLFFGKPDKEEITEKGKNLIYGTSKQAGDWFKFEDDYLKSFTIK